jgi:arylsulfatase A
MPVTRREFLRYGAAATAAALLPRGVRAAPEAPPARPLNLVLILADDLGYECIGANGGTSYRTPHLDRMAAGGVRFEHCYAQPLCTPTRAQLMTGIYNVRNYTRFGQLAPQAVTFAAPLKRAGYATCIAGKWQLGGGPEAPKAFGFDEYYLWQHTRRPPRYANPGLEIMGEQVDYANGEYGPDLIDARALDFIGRNKERPFFLYYPMILPHDPFQPTPDSPDWDPKAVGEGVNQKPAHYGEMVTYMDKLVGRLLTRLDELKLRENTLVLFLGDNGTHPSITSRMGERVVTGDKGASTDGGTHVPLICGLPAGLPGGRVLADLVDTTDFLPTLLEAAGVALPSDLKIDGQSFWPQLGGEPGRPRAWVYSWFAQHGGPTATAEFARTQRYKLYADARFYDMAADPLEQKPLDPALDADAASARGSLQKVLDDFKNARPAAVAAKGGRRNQGGEK